MRYGLYDTMQQQDPSTAPASPATEKPGDHQTMQQQDPSTAPASPSTAKPGDHEILLDVTLESTAPMHATGDVELLTDVRAPAPGEQYETFGSAHPVAAVGRLATPHFDVPGLGMRTVVVSVGELARREFVVGFGPGTCDVTDVTTGHIVGKGRRRDGRYYLNHLRVPSS